MGVPASERHDAERMILCEVTVKASQEEVWKAWTTPEGVRSFFAPECRVELVPGGAYEMYFDPSAEPGSRGGEGNTILAMQEGRMLSFTWNAPPSLPTVRGQWTHVTVRLHPGSDGRTRVVLRQDGWGGEGEWDEAFRYFERAWGGIVLPRLAALFDSRTSSACGAR
jgi:uncharacterized protein YndB with AHSA1/START domain